MMDSFLHWHDSLAKLEALQTGAAGDHLKESMQQSQVAVNVLQAQVLTLTAKLLYTTGFLASRTWDPLQLHLYSFCLVNGFV